MRNTHFKSLDLSLFLFSLLIGCGQSSHRIAPPALLSTNPVYWKTRLIETLPTSLHPTRQDYLQSWATQDPRTTQIEGTSTDSLIDKVNLPSPQKEIIVAVIDTGVDIEHPDLREKIWTDPKTGIHGWNFLGNSNGLNLIDSNLEIAREYGRFSRLLQTRPLTAQESIYFAKVQKTYEELIAEEKNILKIFTEALAQSTAESANEYKALIKLTEKTLEITLNPDFNPSSVIGDDPEILDESTYGNSDLLGGDGIHGTHVAGIIARQADSVKIMPIRAVPRGDERDKDIANAIKFAVNHGAKIINLSLGKAFSSHPEKVWQAIQMAEEKDVLIVSSSGNDGKNLDEQDHFPTRNFKDPLTGTTRLFPHWIVVGASAATLGPHFVPIYNNYGIHSVDLFAPGDRIISTTPNGNYRVMSGTSMAAPQVTGAAALLWSRYPNLHATQIKDLLLQGVRKHRALQVKAPKLMRGLVTPERLIPFCELSLSCGILDVFNTIQLIQSGITWFSVKNSTQ